MAQSVEQLIRNQQVAGSSPASSSILKRAASRNRLAALFTGFRPTFHRRSGATFSFLSFFFRAASPVTRLPCFAFYFCLVKRYSVANASPSPRIYRSFCFLLLTSPASSSKLDLIKPNGSIKSFFVETTQFDTFYLINILRFAVLQPQKAILIAVCNTRLTTNSTDLDCDFLFSLQNFVANIDLLFEK